MPPRRFGMQAEVDGHPQRDTEEDRADRDVIRLLREVGEEAERLDRGDTGRFEERGRDVRDGLFVERQSLALARVVQGTHAAQTEDDVVEKRPCRSAGSRDDFGQLSAERRLVQDGVEEVEVVEVAGDVAR